MTVINDPVLADEDAIATAQRMKSLRKQDNVESVDVVLKDDGLWLEIEVCEE